MRPDEKIPCSSTEVQHGIPGFRNFRRKPEATVVKGEIMTRGLVGGRPEPHLLRGTLPAGSASLGIPESWGWGGGHCRHEHFGCLVLGDHSLETPGRASARNGGEDVNPLQLLLWLLLSE